MVWAGCLRAIFCINKVCGFGCKNRKSYQKFKIMLESCQETSKLSVDSFMASWDRVVPQKSDFWKKILKNVANNCLTPPWLVNCVISTVRPKIWDGQYWKWKNSIFRQIDETSKAHNSFSICSTKTPRVWIHF